MHPQKGEGMRRHVLINADSCAFDSIDFCICSSHYSFLSVVCLDLVNATSFATIASSLRLATSATILLSQLLLSEFDSATCLLHTLRVTWHCIKYLGLQNQRPISIRKLFLLLKVHLLMTLTPSPNRACSCLRLGSPKPYCQLSISGILVIFC